MLNGPPTQVLSLQDKLGADLVEYFFYPEDELMDVHWHGHLTGDAIVRGVEQGGKWREQFSYAYVLNDKSDTSGDWSDALPWLEYEWLPQAVKVGVQAMAYVFSPDRDNQFASQELVEALRPHMAIALFEDRNLALEWLEQQRQHYKARAAATAQSHAA